MSDEKKMNHQNEGVGQEQLSLNDDRRVKVLSPGALVAKRFFRNRGLLVSVSIFQSENTACKAIWEVHKEHRRNRRFSNCFPLYAPFLQINQTVRWLRLFVQLCQQPGDIHQYFGACAFGRFIR